jgi:hypothetical protein
MHAHGCLALACTRMFLSVLPGIPCVALGDRPCAYIVALFAVWYAFRSHKDSCRASTERFPLEVCESPIQIHLIVCSSPVPASIQCARSRIYASMRSYQPVWLIETSTSSSSMVSPRSARLNSFSPVFLGGSHREGLPPMDTLVLHPPRACQDCMVVPPGIALVLSILPCLPLWFLLRLAWSSVHCVWVSHSSACSVALSAVRLPCLVSLLFLLSGNSMCCPGSLLPVLTLWPVMQ